MRCTFKMSSVMLTIAGSELPREESHMDRGRLICEELKRAGIRHIAWLPETETHFMNGAMLGDPEIQVVQVCKEGEAIAICAGLYLAGMRGAALMENQGLFESGNVLKWAISLEVPMLILVGVMGYRLHIEQSLAGRQEGPASPELRLVGAAFDITKPFLEALGISRHHVQSDDDVKKLGLAFDEALSTRRPVAVLLTSADGYVTGTAEGA